MFFVEPATEGALHEVAQLPGVVRCEPIRGAATKFRFGHRSRRVGIIGLSPDARLYRLLDAD